MNRLEIFFRKIYKRFFYQNKLEILIKNGLAVGNNIYLADDVIIDFSHCWHIKIGNSVTFAPRVHIMAHDASTKIFLNNTKIGKVTIGDRVFIGAASIILPGVTIGNDVIIGAGGVVTNDIPDMVVAAGNPAKVICSMDVFLSKRLHEMEIYPAFGEEYTIRKKVTDNMKREMNQRMKDRYGYII